MCSPFSLTGVPLAAIALAKLGGRRIQRRVADKALGLQFTATVCANLGVAQLGIGLGDLRLAALHAGLGFAVRVGAELGLIAHPLGS